ncbi:hypothetical protein CXR04_07225 [Streptomyces sp. CMB-StM0423]|nr:hypothetical protein CXR04_07225 [Streptomyces sp. CMB-StM0423]
MGAVDAQGVAGGGAEVVGGGAVVRGEGADQRGAAVVAGEAGGDLVALLVRLGHLQPEPPFDGELGQPAVEEGVERAGGDERLGLGGPAVGGERDGEERVAAPETGGGVRAEEAGDDDGGVQLGDARGEGQLLAEAQAQGVAGAGGDGDLDGPAGAGVARGAAGGVAGGPGASVVWSRERAAVPRGASRVAAGTWTWWWGLPRRPSRASGEPVVTSCPACSRSSATRVPPSPAGPVTG